MKKHFITGLLATFAIAASAQSFTEWQNPEVNAVNRAPMHTNYFAYESVDAAARGAKEQSSNYMTLNGTWKFFWVKNADARPTDFWKVGFNDKGWSDMAYVGTERFRRPYLREYRICLAQSVQEQSTAGADGG